MKFLLYGSDVENKSFKFFVYIFQGAEIYFVGLAGI